MRTASRQTDREAETRQAVERLLAAVERAAVAAEQARHAGDELVRIAVAHTGEEGSEE